MIYMKILVIVPGYPSDNSISYQFVHDRLKEYIKKFNLDVFCYNKKFKLQYEYEGINVYGGNRRKLMKKIKERDYNCVVFHFMTIRNALIISKHLSEQKVLVWFHGTDCLGWRRRLSSINYSRKKIINPIFCLKLLRFVIFNKIKLFCIKKVNQKNNNVNFVFVSKWLFRASQKDLGINFKNYVIIPNYINMNIFKYQKKTTHQRLNVLSISNYVNDLYGGDMIQKIIIKFSTKKEFKYFNFTIYGDGLLFNKYTENLKKFNNVCINKGFLTKNQIPGLHDNNGILLYPKRGDSQGVSRCEAMASGLVPLALDVEAVSEFSPKDTSYLVKTTEDFINALLRVYYNPQEFLLKSKMSNEYIRKKCSYDNTIKKEIELLMTKN